MPPGDPDGEYADSPTTSEQNIRDQSQLKMADEYTPEFSVDDWFVARIIDYSDFCKDIDEVYKAVKFWKNIADELRSNGYPLHERDTENFDPILRKKAFMLHDFLDLLIHKTSLSSFDLYQRLRIMLAQGDSYASFKERMNKLDISTKCNQIWDNDAVAYRCNTCALSPCMSLCESCFEENGHKGHDFTRFFSREGGACDCGNEDVIKPQGCCKRHGPNVVKPETNFLDVSLPEFIIAKLLTRLFLSLRGWKQRAEPPAETVTDPKKQFNAEGHSQKEMKNVKVLIEFLQEIINYGGPLREATARILLDKKLYQGLTSKSSAEVKASDRIEVSLDWRTARLFEEDKMTLALPTDVVSSFPLLEGHETLECHSLLDETIIWIIRENFPQNLINFSLSMLSESDYRDEFALRFFRWYPLVGKVIRELCTWQMAYHRLTGDKVQGACSRVIHISVQMLSSASLCEVLNEKCDIVNTVCNVTMYLLCEKTEKSKMTIHPNFVYYTNAELLEEHYRSEWDVMKIEKNGSVSQHGYWFVMGDMQNLLSHPAVAISTVLNERTFAYTYMNMLSRMQGMNQIWRIATGNHREIDTSDNVQKAYTLEFETLAVTLFNMVSAIVVEEHSEAALVFFDTIMRTLVRWFDELLRRSKDAFSSRVGPVLRCQPYCVSFHIPLHRHISTALSHFSEIEGFHEYLKKTLLSDESKIRLLILHPLRIQAARSEINCGMWVRNGAEARILSLIYAQWNVNNAFQTPDIDLIRYCSAHMEKDHLITMLLSAFHLDEKVRFHQSLVGKPQSIRRKLFAGVETKLNAHSHSETRYSEDMDTFLDDLDKLESLIEQTNNENLPAGELIDEGERLDILHKIHYKENMTNVLLVHNEEERTPMLAVLARSIIEARREFDIEAQRETQQLFGLGLSYSAERKVKAYPTFNKPDYPHSILMKDSENVAPVRPVLNRDEWVDPMIMGLFKLIAEIVVVRVNCGATPEEHYRSEMINCLASSYKMTHSRLRSCISEKGSRGSETIDKVFDEILNEIAVFIDPDEQIAANTMYQGVYVLKDEVWDEQLCPVFCMMRSNSQKQVSEVFAKLCEKEKDSVKKRDIFKEIKSEEKFWVPFKLIDFDKNLRSKGIANVYPVLITEKLMITCIVALSEEKTFPKFHEVTIQLAVYLLTLGVKYAQTLECDEETKNYMIRLYHTPFNIKTTSNTTGEFSTHTIFSFLFDYFEKEAKRLGCYEFLLEKILDGSFDRDRIYGGAAVYLGRFFAILAKLSPTCSRVLKRKLADDKNVRNQKLSEDNKTQDSKNTDKENARKRMAMIIENQRKKNLATMEKMMEAEGMTKEELDSINTEKPDVCLYECPICGDSEMPNTLRKPFGMLVKFSTNFLAEEQIDASLETIDNLLELDDNKGKNIVDLHTVTRRVPNELRRSYVQPGLKSDVSRFHPVTGVDLKTCGHTAHIECFNAYRMSLHNDRVRKDMREVGCPLCRFTVNSIFPLAIDFGFESKNHGPFKSQKLAYRTLRDCLVLDRKISEEDDEAYREHYSMSNSSRGFGEVIKSRSRTSDATESKLVDKNGTVSSSLIAMAVAAVERSSLLRILNVPERRKNTRHSLTKHLLTAASVTKERREEIDLLSIIGALFGSVFATGAELENSNEKPMETDQEEKGPIEEKQSAEDEVLEVENIIMGLSKDELKVLLGPPVVERGDANSLKTEVADNGSPLLAFEPKTMLTRLLSMVIEDMSLSKQDKSSLCIYLVDLMSEAVLVRVVFKLIPRLDLLIWLKVIEGVVPLDDLPESVRHVPQVVSRTMPVCPSYRDLPTEPVKTIDIALFCFMIRTHYMDFVRFASELLLHLDIIPAQTNDLVHQPDFTFESALKVTQSDDISDRFFQKKIQNWVNTYQHESAFRPQILRLAYVNEPLAFKPRFPLKLPEEFDDLFSRYFHRECSSCNKVPSNPLVCIMCSALVCLDDCCRILPNNDLEMETVSEPQYHSEECSSSSGLFISLTSSLIIVVRGKQAAIWGSVYLDAHGEEDRNLRRGKPLKLSQKRFECLQKDWFEQEWGRVRQWIQLANSLMVNQIRDSHLNSP